MQKPLKVHSYVTSAFVFFFDLCRPLLENANVKCEHHHLSPETPFLKFDTNADVTCEQGLSLYSHQAKVGVKAKKIQKIN